MKKDNEHIRCYYCKKVFSCIDFNMAMYKYCKCVGSKKRYFCSYSCMQAFKRKTGIGADKRIIIEYPEEEVKPKGAFRVHSPAGSQFY